MEHLTTASDGRHEDSLVRQGACESGVWRDGLAAIQLVGYGVGPTTSDLGYHLLCYWDVIQFVTQGVNDNNHAWLYRTTTPNATGDADWNAYITDDLGGNDSGIVYCFD